jgi:hypothetical protein
MQAAREKAAERRDLDRRISGLTEVAGIAAKQAGRIELYAAKNRAASFDKGAERKLKHAAELRRLATFLADNRLHQRLREDADLREILVGEVKPKPIGYIDHMRPRQIDLAAVKPTRPRSFRHYDEFGYEE